jgi:DNA-binding PadR family transcriptional regulator
MLSDGPSYGYELKARFEAAMGPQWGSLNIGHVYQVLDRLLRDGLAVAHTEAQAARPDRVVYEITEPGREAVAAWLGESSPAAAGYRDDLFLKLMTVARLGDEAVFLSTMTQARRDLMQELRDLGALRDSRHLRPDRPLNGLLVTAAELQVGARLQFVEAALAERGALLAERPEPVPGPASADPAEARTVSRG